MRFSVAFVAFLTVACVAAQEETCSITGCPAALVKSSRFAGKVFMVSGAGSGIGEVVSRHLAADGAHVVLAARRKENLEKVRTAIVADGGNASVLLMDVLDYENVEKGINGIVKEHGKLDGAFNNAGGGGDKGVGTVVDVPMKDFKVFFELNFYGTVHQIKAEMQVMTKQGFGAIVNNLSILATKHFPSAHAYTAAKRGVSAIQDAAAVEGAPVGVRVNSVSPGFTLPSESLQASFDANPGLEPAFYNPQGKLVSASEVYGSVAFLLDEKTSSSVTGADIQVAGGHNVPIIKLG